MRTIADILLVTLALGSACVYAFCKLAPRWTAAIAARSAGRFGSRWLARAAAFAASNTAGSCSSCGSCESDGGKRGEAAEHGNAEVRVAVSEIRRRL
jgi:hypothetical protein